MSTASAIPSTRAGASPSEAAHRAVDREAPCATRYYAWELPVRLSHWLVVLSVAVLSVTGFYIGHPFLVVPGEARFHFVMGTMKALHFYSAIVFTLAVLSRVIWMFRGNEFASWHQFLPVSKERRRDLIKTLRFYLFLEREMPPCGGHNPAAGLTYLVVFMLYSVIITTGLALYGASAHIDSPLRLFAALAPMLGGLQTARFIHHVGMWLLLGFVVHHIYSAVMVAIVEKTGVLDSIFTGYRYSTTMEVEGRRRAPSAAEEETSGAEESP